MDIVDVKKEIEDAFRPVAYRGRVTGVDGEPFAEEIDDDLSLYEHLRCRDWKSIEPSFIDFQCGGLPLLTDTAFVSFLPAWLVRALDIPGADNAVREFVIYSLSGQGTDRRPDRLRLLSAQQRKAVIRFLEAVSEIEPTPFLRGEAAIALKMLQGIDPESS